MVSEEDFGRAHTPPTRGAEYLSYHKARVDWKQLRVAGLEGVVTDLRYYEGTRKFILD